METVLIDLVEVKPQYPGMQTLHPDGGWKAFIHQDSPWQATVAKRAGEPIPAVLTTMTKETPLLAVQSLSTMIHETYPDEHTQLGIPVETLSELPDGQWELISEWLGERNAKEPNE